MEISPENGAEAGRMIKAALKMRVDRKMDTQRKAATRAGISEAWWRQVVNGGQNRGGVWVAAVGSVATYVAMAKAVGIDADTVLDVLEIPDDERIFAEVPVGPPVVELDPDLEEYVAEPGGKTSSALEERLTALINERFEQMTKDVAEMVRRERS